MIHRFSQGGIDFVLDINSGAIHVVDDVVMAVLDYYPMSSVVDTVRQLAEVYDEKEIRAAISEVDELIDEGLLYSEEEIFPIAFKRTIKALCLNVSHDCNMRCKYCFASQGDYEGRRELMPLETGKAALDFLVKNSEGRRNLEVDFFGGEPLMNFDVVKELVSYGRKIEKEHGKNFRFTITTNGLLLDDEKIDYINEHMDNVVMSIDGRKEVNDSIRPLVGGGGSYDLIVAKFKRLIEKREELGKQYFVRGTFTALNTDFFEDVKHLRDLGFKNISIEPVVTDPGSPFEIKKSDLDKIFEQYDELAEDLAKNKEYNFFHFNIDLEQGPCMIKRISGCGAGLDYLAVTPNGDLYPCHQFVGDEDFIVGNVFEGISPDAEKLTMKFARASAQEKEKCRQCWAKYYCSGGCHANAYNMNGDIMTPYEIGCLMEKKRVECSIYLYTRRKLDEENNL